MQNLLRACQNVVITLEHHLSSVELVYKSLFELSGFLSGVAHNQKAKAVFGHLVHFVGLSVLRIGVGGLLKIEETEGVRTREVSNISQYVVVSFPEHFRND